MRFAILGAVIGGAGVPLFLQTMNVLSGDGLIAWHLVLDDAVWAAPFGAAAAAASILLARRAEAVALRASTRAASLENHSEAGDSLSTEAHSRVETPAPRSGAAR